MLPDSTDPWLLARVRWPDVFEAISPAQPNWQADVGLFDLPYDASSVAIDATRAAEIATAWGAELPSEDGPVEQSAPLIRRMPANWSSPSPTDLRVWRVDVIRAVPDRTRPRWWSRRRHATTGTDAVVDPTNTIIDLTDGAVDPTNTVIDLTDGAVAARQEAGRS